MNYQPKKDNTIDYLSQARELIANGVDLPEGDGTTNIERAYYIAGKLKIPFEQVPEFIVDIKNALGVETKTLP